MRYQHSLMMPSQYSFLVAPIVHLFYLRHNTLPSITRASALPLCAYGAAALSEVTGNGNASLNVPKPVIGYPLHRSLQYLSLTVHCTLSNCEHCATSLPVLKPVIGYSLHRSMQYLSLTAHCTLHTMLLLRPQNKMIVSLSQNLSADEGVHTGKVHKK